MNNFEIKVKKKTTQLLYLVIIILISSISLLYWGHHIKITTKDTGITLHELIKEGSKKEDEIVSLEITEKPFLFAEYDTKVNSNKYYFLMDENYLYIGYLDYKTYLKLNNIDNNPITIKGITKLIPDDVIDIAIEVYNDEIGEEFLTVENYKSYIGQISIDTVSPLIDNIFQYSSGIILFITALIIFIVYIIRITKINKLLKSEKWLDIKKEVEKSNCIIYDKLNLYLTENYIIDYSNQINIIPYSDIIWIYLFESHQYKIINIRNIVVMTKDKKKKEIANISINKNNDIYLDIINTIYQKNTSMLVGYTKENIKKVKDSK